MSAAEKIRGFAAGISS